MLFKLSLKNIKKSFKDYAIYFLTLVLGVALFYMFNSLDAQEAMLKISESTKQIIKLLISMLSALSIFIAVILGFLIVYANNFLIKRRKKEFGIYMTLGMGRRKISQILLIETILIGIISLAIGLVVGIFASQLMSVVVAKMFEVDMTKYQFVFSPAATLKTLICFGIMYLAVLVFNTITISRYKLIDLITAFRKNEKVKIKNTALCIIVFLISIALLTWAYYTVTINYKTIMTEELTPLLRPIIAGCIGTFLFFWASSGFILKLVQSCKKIYLKGTNMFILRQINSQINTTVFSMTIICLMLFVTICVLSSALALNNSFTKSIKEVTPVDINIEKLSIREGEKRSEKSITETLAEAGFDLNKLTDVVEVPEYSLSDLTMADTLKNGEEELKEQFPMLELDVAEDVMKVSDYNKIAKLYKNEELELNDDQYIIVSDYTPMKNIRNKVLETNQIITIAGKKYSPKYTECKEGAIEISGSHINLGIIIVPDSCDINSVLLSKYLHLAANYNAETDEDKKQIENELTEKELNAKLDSLGDEGKISGTTKITIYESQTGLSAIVTFVALYLGVIFLIASSAILALKELSDSSDNKQRYTILRKIGTDEKMISKSLFIQIGIFFLIPLLLAIVHSIFGIKFALIILSTILDGTEKLVQPIILTALFITLIYGGYFTATYLCSKNIIKE